MVLEFHLSHRLDVIPKDGRHVSESCLLSLKSSEPRLFALAVLLRTESSGDDTSSALLMPIQETRWQG